MGAKSFSRLHGAVLVTVLSLAAYANSFGNRFAYDDLLLIQLNPAVHAADWTQLAGGPYWPEASDGVGLYRPIPMLSYALDWRIWDGAPFGFHLVNVALHTAVTLLVFALLLTFAGTVPATAGAVAFGIHPVHVEAVANVVGRSELLAALFYIAAGILYLRVPDPGRRSARAARLLAIPALYFAALASKESAVTLPVALLLLDAGVRALKSGPPLRRKLVDELPLFVLLAVAFAAYLGLRYAALGGFVGDTPHPALRGLSSGQRVFTALAVWPHYLRLLVFPLDLSSDYSPAVLQPAGSLSGAVALGAAVLLGLGITALAMRRRASLASVGIAWFFVTIFPVSNLVVPVGILLAERTLYLPSLGIAFVIALVPDALRTVHPRRTRVAVATACLIPLLLLARTVTRNPVWRDTDAMYATLIEDHPESYRALWALAGSLEVQGRPDLAWRAFREALALAPDDYGLLVDAGRFLGQNARWQESEGLLRHAIAVRPELARAYRTLSIQLVRRGQLEAGIETALTGLARARRTSELWSALAVAHATAEDFAAAVRAQETAVALDARVAAEWLRLAEYRDALGDAEGAGRARQHAQALGARPGAGDAT